MTRSIFRKYDIRGLAEQDLDDQSVRDLARSIAVCLKREGVARITIGQDCRLSSPRIAETLSQGLLDSGIDVIRLGTVPSPVVYYSQYQLDVQGGIVVTASHNPAAYNGLKIVVNGEVWSGEQIQQIGSASEDRDRLPAETGQVQSVSLVADYSRALLESIGTRQTRLRLVIDCGNGTTAGLAASIYRKLGFRVTELFGTMDGRFPNHHPDPSVEDNLSDLKGAVLEEEADVGLAFDGDGDRVAAVDERGCVIWGDQLTLLFARDLLETHAGATVIGDVKCSRHLFQEVERLGGRALMTPSGHSIVRREMVRTGALLAGEMSGHIFFSDRWFGFDDAVYAGGRLLELLVRTGLPLSQVIQQLPFSVMTPELRVEVGKADRLRLVSLAQRWFSSRYPTSCIDGVRVEFPEGWGLIRASNTGPYLVLRFEALTAHDLARIRELIESPLSDMIEGRGAPSEASPQTGEAPRLQARSTKS